MNNELFIKIKETYSEFFESFKRGLGYWTVVDDATPVVCGYGVVYLHGGEITRTLDINDYPLGDYRIDYTITADETGATSSIGNVEITFGGVTIYPDSLVGSFNSYITTISGSDLIVSGGFGGVAALRITPMKSDYKKIYLYDDVDIPLTFNIADIQDFTKRNSSFSKTITIPGSTLNNKLFKHIYNITTNGSFELNKPVDCVLYQDTLLVFRGSFELTKCILDMNREVNYEGIIYSNITTLYTKIGNKYLFNNDDFNDDLDFSEYKQEFSLSNIVISFSATHGSGVLYLPIDKQNRGSDGGGSYPGIPTIYKVEDFTQCLYIKEIWDKIFEKAGFTYTSTFLNTEYVKSLIYPATDRFLIVSQDVIDSKRWEGIVGPTCSIQTDFTKVGGGYVPGTQVLQTNTFLNWDTQYNGSMSSWDDVTNEFTCKEAGYYDIGVDYTFGIFMDNLPDYGNPWTLQSNRIFAGVLQTPSLQVNTHLKLNGVDIDSDVYNYDFEPAVWIYGTERTQFTKKTITFGVLKYLKVGDKVRMDNQLFITNGAVPDQAHWFWVDPFNNLVAPRIGISPESAIGYVGNINSFRITPTNQVTQDMPFLPQTILNKDKQTDFLTSIIKMFNLYVESTGDNSFIIEPRDDYYMLNSDMSGVKDWTNKVDWNKGITIQRKSDLIEKVIDFRYDIDDDYYSNDYKKTYEKEYGSYYKINTQNKDINNKYETKLLFATLINAPIKDGSKIEVPKLFALDEDGTLQTGTSFKSRILYYGGIKNSGEVFIITENPDPDMNTYIMKNNYPYAGHLNDLYGNDTLDLMFWQNPFYWSDVGQSTSSTASATTNNLINTYYKNTFNELLDPNSKLVTMNIRLYSTDMEHLHFYDIIFINNVYYRLNKISNYTNGGFAKVELLSITNQLFGWPTPIIGDITTDPDKRINEFSKRPFKKKTSSDNKYIDMVCSSSYLTMLNSIENETILKIDLITNGWYDAPFTDDDKRMVAINNSDYFVDMIVNREITTPIKLGEIKNNKEKR